MSNQLSKENSILVLKTAIENGIEAWQKAGESVVSLVDDHKMSLDEIEAMANCEIITVNVLAQFERIGRRQVMPKLLVLDFPASKYLQRLPFSEQHRLIEGSVDLLVIRDSGTDTLMVKCRDLTPDQCKQVFSRNEVRSLSAQRAFMEDRRKKLPCNAGLPTWQIKHGKVVFNSACELTRKELSVILSQLA